MEILRKTFTTKKSKLFFVLLTVLFTSITSCEKDAGVRLPDIPSKLVILSFICPQDTIIRVEVRLSQPLYNNAEKSNYKSVPNALVTISSNLGSATLTYDPVEEYYKIDSAFLKIRGGMEYTINVSTPDGKAAGAVTTIPSQNNSLDISVNPDSSLKVAWTDPPETVDYYRLLWQNSAYYLIEGQNQNGSFSDTIYSTYAVATWYTDTDSRNGGFITNIDNYNYKYLDEDLYILLFHVSKEYYDYGVRLQQVMNTTNNPFSEAIPMYTNVNGGFGVFAGYNMTRKKAP